MIYSNNVINKSNLEFHYINDNISNGHNWKNTMSNNFAFSKMTSQFCLNFTNFNRSKILKQF